jgi:hypothetical protein
MFSPDWRAKLGFRLSAALRTLWQLATVILIMATSVKLAQNIWQRRIIAVDS